MNFHELKKKYELQKLMNDEHNINAYVLLAQYLILQEGIIIPKKYHSCSLSVFFKTIKVPLVNSFSRIFSGLNQSEPKIVATPIQGLVTSIIPSIKLTGMSTKKEITILHFNNNYPLSYYFHEKREDILLTIPKDLLLNSSGQLLTQSIQYFNYDILKKEYTEPSNLINKPIMLSDIIFDLNRYCQLPNWSLTHVLSHRLKYFKKLGFHIPEKSIKKVSTLVWVQNKILNSPNGLFNYLELQDIILYNSSNVILNNLYRNILGNPTVSYKTLTQEIKKMEKENLKAEKIPDILYSYIKK